MPECGTSSLKGSAHVFFLKCRMCPVKTLFVEKERGLLKLQRMRFVPPAGIAVFIRPRWRWAFPDHPRLSPKSSSEERGWLCGCALSAWAAIPTPLYWCSMEGGAVTFYAASKRWTPRKRAGRWSTGSATGTIRLLETTGKSRIMQ